MKKLFTDHPNSVGETYLQHMKHASTYGFNMLFGGVACLLHAVFPFMCKSTGSNVLLKMTHHFVSRMPCTEKRMTDIAKIIEEKAKMSSSYPYDIS